MKTRILLYAFYIFFALFINVKHARAYLDPGTGSFIFQTIVASLLALSYFLRSSIKKFFEGFREIILKVVKKRK